MLDASSWSGIMEEEQVTREEEEVLEVSCMEDENGV